LKWKTALGVSAAGHRADFERERERCDTLMTEALMLAKVAMSARKKLRDWKVSCRRPSGVVGGDGLSPNRRCLRQL
jgi:hypothetical protein